MAQRKPKLINKTTVASVKAVASKIHTTKSVSPLYFASAENEQHYIPPPPPTPIDKLYNLIYDKCVWGYRFTDNYYGIPWIEKDDIEDKGNGIYVVRFRSPEKFAGAGGFGSMAKDVCEALNCNLHVFHKTRREVYGKGIGLGYEDYVWVIQPGELDVNTRREEVEEEAEENHFYDEIEDVPDNWIEAASEEDIEARIAKAMAEFV